MKRNGRPPTKEKAAPKKRGPKPVITASQWDQIFDLISTSDSGLEGICKKVGVIHSTVIRRIAADKEICTRYARAKAIQADYILETLLDIADDSRNDWIEREDKEGSVSLVENKEAMRRTQIRLQERHWILARLNPKKYGDKLDLTSDGDKIEPTKIQVEVLPVKKAAKNG